MTATRIVSTPRGSWRWQNAYKIATYAPQRTKDGRWIWKSIGRSAGKMSLPQIRRNPAIADLEVGSLHNQPIPAEIAGVLEGLRNELQMQLETPEIPTPEDFA